MVPELLEHNEIISKSYEIGRNKIGVYFLINENKIVYVGKTIKGLTRAYSHLDNKIFDRIYFLPCLEEELNILEANYIVKYAPLYNIALNDSNCFLTIKNIKNLLRRLGFKDTDIRKIKKYIAKNNIEEIYFNEKLYIHKNNFNAIKEYMMGVNK